MLKPLKAKLKKPRKFQLALNMKGSERLSFLEKKLKNMQENRNYKKKKKMTPI